MEKRQRQTLDAMQRMLDFVTTAPLPEPLRPDTEGLPDEIATLRNAITETETYAVNQGSGQVYKFTKHRRHVRNILREEHLNPIRAVGKVLERTIPGMPSLVNLPTNIRNERALLVAATATLRDVRPYQDHYIARGFPRDFIARLEAAIAAVVNVREGYADVKARKLAGLKGIQDGLRAGLDARACLSAIVHRCCLTDPVNGPATLRAWHRISRVQRAMPGRKGVDEHTSPGGEAKSVESPASGEAPASASATSREPSPQSESSVMDDAPTKESE